ncbi:hypothetical protein EDC04DRAFT_2601761 [Pisolithus marmoratus]|nr:hypothetical protein EDC04DRAFT_2601761 [Pisolithus marmoratus]
MSSNPELRYLKENISKLQLENIALKAERNAVQNTYNTLVAQLSVVGSDSCTSPEDSTIKTTLRSAPVTTMPLLNADPLPQLNWANYRKTRSWTEEEWKRWCMTPEGQCSNLQTLFLKDDTGVTSILQGMCGIWHGFRKCRAIDAETTWVSMPLMVKNTFRIEITHAFPELNLCADSWKSDMLAKKHYPSFKQTWFTNRSDERTANSTKCKMKTETTVGDTVSPTPKRAKLHLGSRSDNGDDNIGDNFVVDTPGDWTSASISTTTSTSTPDSSLLGPVTQSSPAPVDSCRTMPDTDAPPRRFGGSTASDTSVVKQGDTGFKISPSLIKNPLSSVHQKEPPMYMCPPQQPSSVSLPVEEGRNPTSASGSNDHIRGGPSQVSHADINGGTSLTVANVAATQASIQAVPGSTLQAKGAEKKTWQPPAYKSAQTLCMHRYQKQIGGSLEEFNLYWDALSEEAKGKYKGEARELVSNRQQCVEQQNNHCYRQVFKSPHVLAAHPFILQSISCPLVGLCLSLGQLVVAFVFLVTGACGLSSSAQSWADSPLFCCGFMVAFIFPVPVSQKHVGGL